MTRLYIKYFKKVLDKVDEDYPMAIRIKENINELSKEELLRLLEKDKVNINQIETIKYYDPKHNGYLTFPRTGKLNLSSLTQNKVFTIILSLKPEISDKKEAQKLISYFDSKLAEIETKSKKINQLEERKEIVELEKGKSSNYFEKATESNLDFVILYSNPIVSEDNKPLKDELLDFEEELSNLKKILSECGKRLTARIEIANSKTLNYLIQKMPKILHITCHGEKTTEFSLKFEGENGKLEKFTKQKLQDILRQKHNIKLVYISACYSENAGKIFFESGVPAVICVQSDSQILDEAAESFNRYFYKQLLEGDSIKNAFEYAVNNINARYFNSSKHCCCRHIHTSNCLWKKHLETKTDLCYEFHNKNCGCKFSESHIHSKTNCNWRTNFIKKFSPVIEEFDEISEKICCCSPEIPHAEFKKFVLKYTNNNADEKIFHSLETGNLEIKNKNNFFNLKFSVDMRKNIIGRKQPLAEVINFFSRCENDPYNNRILTILGNQGLCKREFVKMAGRYMYERRFFMDGVVYIENKYDLDKKKIIKQILNDLGGVNVLRSQKNFYNTISKLNILIIFYYKDLGKNDFSSFLSELIEFTKLPKILVATDEPLKINSKIILLSELKDNEAMELLKTVCTNSRIQIKEDKWKELYQSARGLPSSIYKIGALLMSGKVKIDELIETIKKEHSQNNDITESLSIMYIENKQQDSLFQEILFYLLHCPNGISEDFVSTVFGGNTNRVKVYLEEMCKSMIIIKNYLKFSKSNNYSLNSIKEVKRTIDVFFRKDEEYKKKESIFFNKLMTYYVNLLRNLIFNFSQNTEQVTEFSAASNYGIWCSLQVVNCSDEYIHLTSGSNSSMDLIKFKNSTEIFKKNSDLTKKNSYTTVDTIPNYLNEKPFDYEKCDANNLDNSIDFPLPKANQLLDFDSIDLIKNTKSSVLRVPCNNHSFNKNVKTRKVLKNKVLNNNPQVLFNPEEIFDSEEQNILCLLSLENLDGRDFSDEFREKFENLTILIPTALKFLKRYDDCLSQINKIIELCRKLNNSTLAIGRLLTFALSLYYKFKSLNDGEILEFKDRFRIENFDDFHRLKLFENIRRCFQNFNEGLAEAIFCNEILKFQELNTPLEELNNALNDALDLYKSGEDDIGIARIIFIKSDLQITFNKKHPEAIDSYLNSKLVFDNYQKFSLSILSLIRIVTLLLEEGKLDQAKYYLNQAVKLSSSHKLNCYEGKLKELKEKLYEELRKKIHNVFVFIKAHQLVKKFENKFVPINNLVSYPSNFRMEIIENFKSLNKGVNVIFDFLTKNSFIEMIERGSRILHISSEDYNDNGSLFVEGEFGDSIEIKKEELAQILSERKCLFEIVIIAIPQSFQLGEIFKRFGPKNINVICFEFNKMLLKKLLNFMKFDFMSTLHRFTVNILEFLLKGMSIYTSLELAREMFRNCFDIFGDQLNEREIDSLNNCANLIQKEDNINYKLFDNSDNEYLINEGELNDLSRARTILSNVEKRNFPYIGRKLEIFEALNYLQRYQDVIVFGESGIGKTSFIKEVGYYLYVRNRFKNGIYYIDLKETTSTEDFKNFFKFYDIESLMRNKDSQILIIFDNCEKLLKLNPNQFKLFLDSFKSAENSEEKSIVFFISFKLDNRNLKHLGYPEFVEERHCIELKQLAPEEGVELFYNYCEDGNLDLEYLDLDNSLKRREEDFSTSLLLKSKEIRKCNNNPKLLKKLALNLKKRMMNDLNDSTISNFKDFSVKLDMSKSKEKNKSPGTTIDLSSSELKLARTINYISKIDNSIDLHLGSNIKELRSYIHFKKTKKLRRLKGQKRKISDCSRVKPKSPKESLSSNDQKNEKSSYVEKPEESNHSDNIKVEFKLTEEVSEVKREDTLRDTLGQILFRNDDYWGSNNLILNDEVYCKILTTDTNVAERESSANFLNEYLTYNSQNKEKYNSLGRESSGENLTKSTCKSPFTTKPNH